MIAKYLELTKSLALLYRMADRTQKARLAKVALSNCSLSGKSLCLEPQNWLREVDATLAVLCGAPVQDRIRTEQEIKYIFTIAENDETPHNPRQKRDSEGRFIKADLL